MKKIIQWIKYDQNTIWIRMTTYTSVKIPKAISEEIRDISESKGYRSVSDFVLDATRSHLRELRK